MATVDSLISSAQTFAETTRDLAVESLSNMRDDIGNVGFVSISFNGATLPNAPEVGDPLTAPTLYPVDLVQPDEPGAGPAFQDISQIDVSGAPTLSASAPTVNLPSTPSAVQAFGETVPAIRTEFDFPDVPSALANPFVEAPTLGTYTTPTAPTIGLPSFDAVSPVNDTAAPTDLATPFAAAYREQRPEMVTVLEDQMDRMLLRVNPQYHTQMTAIETQLSRYLAGGTGLSANVENAIYERARGKESAEFRRAERAAMEAAASNGFTIPDGAAFSAMHSARQAAADNNARSANEIAIKQAEMEQANLQFAVTTSAALRNAALSASLSYHGNLVQINGQALEYAKSTAGFIVEIYNASVRAFEARLDAYKAEAQVYDTRLKAALSLRDLYESEIRALQALVTVDQAKVALYRGRIDAINTLANVYKTQVEVVVEQAGLEKMQIDLFKTKVDAYVATVQGKKAEYDGYAAALSGEEAKVRIYGAQVNAYSAEVSGYRAKIDTQAEVVRGQATTNRARADQYKSELDAFSTKVQARGDKARLELDIQRAQLNAYEVENRATIASTELAATVYKAKSDIILQNTKLEVETLIKNAQLTVDRAKVVADLGVASAKVHEGMTGAALSGMNTLVAQTLAE